MIFHEEKIGFRFCLQTCLYPGPLIVKNKIETVHCTVKSPLDGHGSK